MIGWVAGVVLRAPEGGVENLVGRDLVRAGVAEEDGLLDRGGGVVERL